MNAISNLLSSNNLENIKLGLMLLKPKDIKIIFPLKYQYFLKIVYKKHIFNISRSYYIRFNGIMYKIKCEKKYDSNKEIIINKELFDFIEKSFIHYERKYKNKNFLRTDY